MKNIAISKFFELPEELQEEIVNLYQRQKEIIEQTKINEERLKQIQTYQLNLQLRCAHVHTEDIINSTISRTLCLDCGKVLDN